ncbi:MAG: hypothetical protein ACXV5J_09385 [Candidatus Angelobacter sp.]
MSQTVFSGEHQTQKQAYVVKLPRQEGSLVSLGIAELSQCAYFDSSWRFYSWQMNLAAKELHTIHDMGYRSEKL